MYIKKTESTKTDEKKQYLGPCDLLGDQLQGEEVAKTRTCDKNQQGTI